MPDGPDDPIHDGEPGSLTTGGELIAAAALVIGAFVLIGGILLLIGPTGTDDPGPSPTVSPGASSGSPSPTQAAFPISPQNEDAIHDLARLSILSIRDGTWADLYDDFTKEFRTRCTAEDFAQAGRDAAISLGDDLSLLAFKGLRELNITGDTARVVMVGELQGKSEYEKEAFFRFEDGAWKIAPSPESTGCAAFNTLAA